MSTTHHGRRYTRNQKLQRTGVILLIMSVLAFGVAAVTGSAISFGVGFAFLLLGGCAIHKADQ